jgi:hypothetical protein
MKIIRYFIEFIIVIIFFAIFKIIGARQSSNLGGVLVNILGLFLEKKK